ncbi:MAG: hypothetical protein WAT39_17330 [Planctomycetota bacterium]
MLVKTMNGIHVPRRQRFAVRVAIGAAVVTAVLGTDHLETELRPTEGPAAFVPTLRACSERDNTVIEVAEATAIENGSHRVDTSQSMAGTVRGEVKIAAMVGRISTMLIVLEAMCGTRGPEGRLRNATRKIVPVVIGAGTHTFEISGIPFSDHPYSVSLYVPGFQSDRRTVLIDSGTPSHDVVLHVVAGSTLAVLLTDQHANPCPGMGVRLVPVEGSRVPTMDAGISDNLGVVEFHDVLSGDYQIVAEQSGTPLAHSKTITVQPRGWTNGSEQERCVIVNVHPRSEQTPIPAR